ncbi:MAG: hypothetical protein ACI8SE_001517 [Bacteroidia bacterium]|jgi:hypothetical protein
MRLIAIITAIICFTSCGLFKKKKQADPTKIVEAPVAEEQPTQPIQTIEAEEIPPQGIKMTYGEICESFLSTLQSGSVDQISQYLPNLSVARAIFGQEASGKSDEEVQAMIDGLTARFMENIEKLRTSASENGVDINTLRVRNCLYFDSEDPIMVPRVLSVELSDGTKDYKIPVTVLNYSGKTYVFKILITTNIFDKE